MTHAAAVVIITIIIVMFVCPLMTNILARKFLTSDQKCMRK